MRSRSAAAREANRAARAHLAVVLDAELDHLNKAPGQRELDLQRSNAVKLVRDRFDRSFGSRLATPT
jgi:hypothetical protein